ncbi:subtilisin-like protein [Coniochaeta ligniaria NRRL 30616]|uniref:Subtilisin-like protein n=1 Tax=Coniochaeta ligniaria NRRL 30616 TaxID=1408157 RepID=A0A1J7IPI5_9PEZI|nr:subtilisin-like protein [Coniochaeta ligniaria NRRL 30616]
MRLQHLFVVLLPLGGVDALSHKLQPLNSTAIAPKKFILEAAQGTDIDALSAKVKASGATILRTFNTDIFTGLSIESTKANVDTLQAVQEVSQAWTVGRIQLSPFKPSATFSDDAAAANYSVHSFTGVDKAHAAGIFGKGVVVAVVDTGTDYLHPALGGGFGPGFKVAGGADLVGDGQWPESGPKAPDSDPLDDLGHGTHVAGIIAGKSEWFTGVAPEATLLSFKVFAYIDSTDEDTLIDAFLQAYEAGVSLV